MKKYKSRGSVAIPVLVQKSYIYFHSNIEERKDEEGNISYTYDVEQLTIEEATKRLVLENQNLKEVVEELLKKVYSGKVPKKLQAKMQHRHLDEA